MRLQRNACVGIMSEVRCPNVPCLVCLRMHGDKVDCPLQLTKDMIKLCIWSVKNASINPTAATLYYCQLVSCLQQDSHKR